MVDGAQALDRRRPWLSHLALFECDHVQPPAHDLQQLAGVEQVIGAERPAEPFIATGEGLVNQHAAGRQAADERGQERTPEVVDDDHPREPARPERPWPGALEIGLDQFQVRIAFQIGDARKVPVDGDDAVAAGEKQAAVAAGPTGDIEHLAGRGHEPGEPANPR